MVSTSSIIPCFIYFTYRFRVSIPVLFQNHPISISTTSSTELQSDSSRPSSPAMNGKSASASASAVAKPPGTQVRCVPFAFHVATSRQRMLTGYSISRWRLLAILSRRRATSSTVQKPNSSRSAGAGGSSNTMLKLYTDDSPGLRV